MSGLELQVVADGQQAIDYINGKPPFNDRRAYPMPDVILLDLKMPKVDGFQFLRWLHDSSPAGCKLIPVIVMSSSSLDQDVNRAYELGANLYMSKPIDWNQFRERIRLLGTLWSAHAESPHIAEDPKGS